MRRRGDPLLQLAHLGGERRLVADGARHAAEQRRDLGARLDEPEDVVDEEQHVLALVAEVLRHRQAGEADAQARARRLVHLAVAERDLVEHARLLHLEQEVVALARALADAGEHRDAAVLRARCCGSAPGSAPSCRRRRRRRGRSCRRGRTGAIRSITLMPVSKISTFGVRSLNAGGSRWIDQRSASGRRAAFSSTGSPSTFQTRPSVTSPTGTEIGAPVSTTSVPRGEAVGRVHRDGADAVVAEVLLHLCDQRRCRRGA